MFLAKKGQRNDFVMLQNSNENRLGLDAQTQQRLTCPQTSTVRMFVVYLTVSPARGDDADGVVIDLLFKCVVDWTQAFDSGLG